MAEESTPLVNFGPKRVNLCKKGNALRLDLIQRFVAELIGTALYMFVGGTSLSNFVGNCSPHLPTVALAFGFSFAGLSGATLHVSGGHLNPAVTLGVFIAGGINVLAVVLYWIAQIIGAVLGALCILAFEYDIPFNTAYTEEYCISGNVSHVLLHYSATQMMEGVNPGVGILVEMIVTMMFVMVFIHTSMEKPELQSTSPALSGLTLAAGILSSYKITGGSMNPARSFGPALISGEINLWKYHYVYWIGPLLGGAIAGGIYRLILASKPLLPLINRTIEAKTQHIQLS